MLLAVDVGNTQTVIGLYQGSQLIDKWRVSTNKESMADELRVLLKSLLEHCGVGQSVSRLGSEWVEADDPLNCVDGIALASVVPHLGREWVAVSRVLFACEALVVDAGVAEDLFQTTYVNPAEIGADRVADAVAAQALYGAPVVVVDFGTATNLEVVDRDGNFVGGIIAPGVATSASALFSAATRLAEIELVAPPTVIGSNTKESVQSGIIYGEVDRVDGLVRRVFDQLGYECPVVATGGLSQAIVERSQTITHVNTELTLEGLRLIYERQMR